MFTHAVIKAAKRVGTQPKTMYELRVIFKPMIHDDAYGTNRMLFDDQNQQWGFAPTHGKSHLGNVQVYTKKRVPGLSVRRV